MKIKWYGHSAFGVTTNNGILVITDVFKPGCYDGAVRYKPITDKADIVVQSHDHDDHNGISSLGGSPELVKDTGKTEVMGITFTGIETFHDHHKGANRNGNTVFVIEANGIRICFCGDLGHTLDKEHIAKIGKVGILMVPIGGHFTIDAKEAWDVVSALNPKIILPMHYKTDVIDFPINGLDSFIQDRDNVDKIGSSEIEIQKENINTNQRIVVLDYVK